jgi:hypothetical protein
MVDPPISTHLGHLLLAGDVGRARRLVMEVYREPLIAYVRNVPWAKSLQRQAGCETAESIVDGFFAERIGKDRVLIEWAGRQCKFRAWVRAALRNYLLTRVADDRQQRANLAKLQRQFAATEGEAAACKEAFDRSLRQRIIRLALQIAGERAADRGKAAEWQAFLAHELSGKRFSELDDLIPGTDGSKSSKLRSMRSLCSEVVREIVAWPCATEGEIDAELEALLGRPAGPGNSKAKGKT